MMPTYIPHDHEPALVVLSYLIALFASYTALDMGERLRTAQGRPRVAWLAGSAWVLGGGIWSMHFIAMLAFRVSIPVSYDVGTTLLSFLIAVLFTGIGFHIVGRTRLSLGPLTVAGTVVGFGVVAMHYTGMDALRLAGTIQYDPALFLLSVLIAVLAAIVALWLAFSLHTTWQKAAAAVVMAAAICGMHFTGMAAMILEPTREVASAASTVDKPLLAVGVAIATFGLFILALISVFVDRRFQANAEREAAALRDANALLQEEVRVRQVAQQHLREMHDALETRVSERTAELESANQRLVAAAIELEAARNRAEREKDRAEAANHAKSDFLASMSHELRTPLNTILGFGQLLEFNPREPLSPKQQRQVSQIGKSGRHLLALIEDVFELSKIEAGAIKLSLEHVALSSVFEEVMATLRPLAEAEGIALSLGMAADLLDVQADRTRLVQILINLGSNAIKYNRPGGTVELKAALHEGGCVRLSVADSGRGIPLDRQAEVFQPFNRLGAESSAIKGAGIGLTITHRLVHMMQGDIFFDSQPDRGTTFFVTLPVARGERNAAAEAAVPLPRQTERRARKRLLYVEDNEANIEVMKDLVEALGWIELLTAGEPGKGLELARTQRPDLIVLDINLPGMSGFDMLAQLKSSPPTAEIPVLALSAAALPREVERGLTAGFTHYLTKPLNVPEFVRAIEGHLRVPA
jgi:diguanylate cyclase